MWAFLCLAEEEGLVHKTVRAERQRDQRPLGS